MTKESKEQKVMYMHEGESPRKLPDDILKLLQTPEKPINQ